MVTALLELARPEQAKLAPTPVMELVRSSIDAARSMVEPEAEVRLVVPERISMARVDEQKVHQALVNLISNAVQATGRRGPVLVRVTVEGEGAPMLRVDVIDDGDGVPLELRERVFAPFFTGRAKGTGLGLAVVRRVAEAHRGSATVEPTPGGGANERQVQSWRR
jgi:signal transduction histidine kinase